MQLNWQVYGFNSNLEKEAINDKLHFTKSPFGISQLSEVPGWDYLLYLLTHRFWLEALSKYRCWFNFIE